MALAIQESWVLNQAIRDNILFGSAYDQERYEKGTLTLTSITILMIEPHFCGCLVIYQCALEQDLEIFDAGDQTEVGERGLTLRCASRYKLAFHVHTNYPEVVARRLA